MCEPFSLTTAAVACVCIAKQVTEFADSFRTATEPVSLFLAAKEWLTAPGEECDNLRKQLEEDKPVFHDIVFADHVFERADLASLQSALAEYLNSIWAAQEKIDTFLRPAPSLVSAVAQSVRTGYYSSDIASDFKRIREQLTKSKERIEKSLNRADLRAIRRDMNAIMVDMNAIRRERAADTSIVRRRPLFAAALSFPKSESREWAELEHFKRRADLLAVYTHQHYGYDVILDCPTIRELMACLREANPIVLLAIGARDESSHKRVLRFSDAARGTTGSVTELSAESVLSMVVGRKPEPDCILMTINRDDGPLETLLSGTSSTLIAWLDGASNAGVDVFADRFLKAMRDLADFRNSKYRRDMGEEFSDVDVAYVKSVCASPWFVGEGELSAVMVPSKPRVKEYLDRCRPRQLFLDFTVTVESRSYDRAEGVKSELTQELCKVASIQSMQSIDTANTSVDYVIAFIVSTLHGSEEPIEALVERIKTLVEAVEHKYPDTTVQSAFPGSIVLSCRGSYETFCELRSNLGATASAILDLPESFDASLESVNLCGLTFDTALLDEVKETRPDFLTWLDSNVTASVVAARLAALLKTDSSKLTFAFLHELSSKQALLTRADTVDDEASAAEFMDERARVDLHHWRLRLDYHNMPDSSYHVKTALDTIQDCDGVTRRGLQKLAYTFVGPILSIYVQVGYPERSKRFVGRYDPANARTRLFKIVCGGTEYRPNVTPLNMTEPWTPEDAVVTFDLLDLLALATDTPAPADETVSDDDLKEFLSELDLTDDEDEPTRSKRRAGEERASPREKRLRLGVVTDIALTLYKTVIEGDDNTESQAFTSLLRAVEGLVMGNPSIFRARINIDGSVTEVPSPLLVACALEKPNMVRALIKNGFDAFIVDDFDRGAFHYAARYGALRVVKRLWKEYKDDPDAVHAFMSPDHSGSNALMLRNRVVMSNDRLELAQGIIPTGSDPTMKYLVETCKFPPLDPAAASSMLSSSSHNIVMERLRQAQFEPDIFYDVTLS